MAKGGEVEMLAKGKPSFIKIQGKGTAAQGELQVDGTKVSGELAFDLQTLTTGLTTRDDHMKNKYLEVAKFPKAILSLKEVKSLTTWTTQSPKLDGATFEAMLTLHGETKPVSGKFSMTEDSQVNAEFSIKLSDFKVSTPSFSGVTVADLVEVKVKITKLESL
jgi:polyisoprenoid-binding protein YceI